MARPWLNEALSVAAFAVALFLFTSWVSVELGKGSLHWLVNSTQYSPSSNMMGPVGHLTGSFLSGMFGWCALVPVGWCAWLALHLWQVEDGDPFFRTDSKLLVLAGLIGLLVFSSMFAAVISGSHAGGNAGLILSQPLVRLFSRLGTGLIAAAFLISSIALTMGRSVADVVIIITRSAIRWTGWLAVTLPLLSFRTLSLLLAGLLAGTSKLLHALFWQGRKEKLFDPRESLLPRPKIRRNTLAKEEKEEAKRKEREDAREPAPHAAEAGEEEETYSHVVVQRKNNQGKPSDREIGKIWKRVGEQMREIEDDAFANYLPPPIGHLTKGESNPGNEDDSELCELSKQIETKLKDFGVFGKVTHIHPGPVITLFEYEPAPGVKVGRIAALQDDLAMGLRASSIRIIAPIPKRGTVGIEVPNRHRDIVRLRDVLESGAYVNAESILSVALGKDTYGEPVVVDIASMPHLLIAGATGTGKSVCINALLLSLLYRASPSQLGLILIDPKILELSVYDNIPHLRVPVVTVPRQAKAVLEWAANEMNRRYRVMQKFGVRNIDSYNKIVSGEHDENGEKLPKKLEDDVVMLREDEVVEGGVVDGPDAAAPIPGSEEIAEPIVEQLKPLPKIVIVIDELADLMLTVGKDVEQLITRLAQKARAAGIHLIVATQRPSVDVITGLIKANFPARLSFRVSSRIDSRTILDQMGADKLLGKGDMLFMQPGAEPLRRVHGAFVSDVEVKRAVAAIKEKCGPRYDERIMAICEKALEEETQSVENGGTATGPDEYDEMYDKCVELVLEKGQASTSMLQRAFRLGYNRAARIIDMMEREGIVGPMDGAKPREVLVHNSESSHQ